MTTSFTSFVMRRIKLALIFRHSLLEPFWYLLNCIAGLEIDLMRQCRQACQEMPDAVKFVVPTETKTRSHGANRMVTEEKVKYPGYVFAKLRLCPEVYEAVQSLDLCRSWMGTINRKGYKKLPPSPVALNELEVENFGLEDLEHEEVEEDESDIIVDEEDDDETSDGVDQEALKVYLGLKVEDMVKVTKKCKFLGEDGIVRRLKDGKILVRFYTYGSMFEEWMEPEDVRVLSNVEILKGLSGPSQPITQRDFDGPDGNFSPRNSPGNLRRNLMSNVKGDRGMRNRRGDRSQRGDQYKRDFFGRSDEEKKREEKNWKWYQENQREKQGRGPQSGQMDDEWNFRGGSPRNEDDSALRDVDSQWGRPSSQRQRRKTMKQQRSVDSRSVQNAVDGKDDWSAFVSSPSSRAPKSPSDEDAFFESLMSDLSEDLSSSPSSSDGAVARDTGRGGPTQNDDDFFASLTSQLSEEVDTGRKSAKAAPQDSSSTDDDFFASLEAELGNAFQDKDSSKSGNANTHDDAEDFFAKLEAEMMPSASSEIESNDSSKDQFSPAKEKLTATIGSRDMDNVDRGSTGDLKSRQPSKKKATVSQSTRPETRGSSSAKAPDMTKLTVPVLKDMLRQRGLKVSGRKAELIERLQQ